VAAAVASSPAAARGVVVTMPPVNADTLTYVLGRLRRLARLEGGAGAAAAAAAAEPTADVRSTADALSGRSGAVCSCGSSPAPWGVRSFPRPKQTATRCRLRSPPQRTCCDRRRRRPCTVARPTGRGRAQTTTRRERRAARLPPTGGREAALGNRPPPTRRTASPSCGCCWARLPTQT